MTLLKISPYFTLFALLLVKTSISPYILLSEKHFKFILQRILDYKYKYTLDHVCVL